MVGLKEQVAEREFQREMNEYLTRFYEVVLNI
jgi:hypothetical protein